MALQLPRARNVIGGLAVLLCAIGSSVAEDRHGAEESRAPGRLSGTAQQKSGIHATKDDGQTAPLRWYVFFAAVNVYPKLESERLLDKFFNRPMRVLAPTFDDAKTFGDMRDDCLLWPPHFGIGRTLSDRWGVFFQAGYSAGKVRTEADDPSLLLLPLHTDVEIRRGAFYAGVGADFFPKGMVELGEYHGVVERIRAAKPYLGTRLTWTYATYDAKVKAGLKPFGNLLDVELSDGWLLPSVNTDLGVEIPYNKRNLISINYGYNFFAERQFDFDGPSLSIAWKHFLRPPWAKSRARKPRSE